MLIAVRMAKTASNAVLINIDREFKRFLSCIEPMLPLTISRCMDFNSQNSHW